MDNGKNNRKEKKARSPMSKQTRLSLLVYLLFALSVATVCFIIFLFNIDDALSLDGDYVPRFFVLLYYYFIACIVFCFAAILIKIILKEKIKIWILLLCAMFLPWTQYGANFMIFTGPLEFIVIGDFNLDGVNDEVYKKRTEFREVTSVDFIDQNNAKAPPFKKIEAVISGRGEYFDNAEIKAFDKNYPDALYGNIRFFASLETNEIKNIDIYVTFNDQTRAEYTRFYIIINENEKIKIQSEQLGNGKVRLNIPQSDIAYCKEAKVNYLEIEWKI